ncbi:hypothetical protein BDA96_02G173100 [Sorghum bicolor]|uniref:Uncharacterized protein n=1 Tax=Sorghum bicolor TaxID=4558 RepID=A0A921RQ39_SORBI|nr:hypothetical protein BDA96_02G173100 [Sorghum bicolor]
MSSALLPLHGSELPTSAASSCSLLQPGQRGARHCGFCFRISGFGFGVKYSGFLHLDPCFLLCCTWRQ